MRKILMAATAAIVMSLGMSGALAGVTIDGTRALFEGGAAEVTVRLGNDGDLPA
ncbi:hypothetical protein [Paraburkholderia sp.]|uniref:hypothetical protein n=1 Tax=Paraburkholderia sp. TaxID=1926495 RepID=UPI003D6E9126